MMMEALERLQAFLENPQDFLYDLTRKPKKELILCWLVSVSKNLRCRQHTEKLISIIFGELCFTLVDYIS